MKTERPILIAGAGIGGLTLALALARAGLHALVIERAPKLEEVGAGLQLSPNASRILDALGLGPQLDAAGARPTAIHLLDGKNGASLGHIPLGPAAERRWGAPYRLIHRAALQAILLRAVEEAGIEIHLGTELVDFASTASGMVVHIRTVHGDDSIVARALIGADGARSAVRTRLGGSPARLSGQIAWRATAHVPGHTATGVWLGPNAHLVSYPLDGLGTLNLVAITHGKAAGQSWAQPGDPAALLAHFRGWAPAAQNLLNASTRWTYWPLLDGGAPPAMHGSATLIGDAAHPILPHLAQGAALAIEDAAVLTRRIVKNSSDLPAAFRAYESARATRTAAIQAAARRNGEIFRMRGPVAFARNAALRIMGPERLTARYDWVYGYRAD